MCFSCVTHGHALFIFANVENCQKCVNVVRATYVILLQKKQPFTERYDIMFEKIQNTGKRVKFYRILNGISQTKLSKIAGKSYGYINRVENEAYTLSPASLMKICEFFGISIKEFFDLDIEAIEKEGLLENLGFDNCPPKKMQVLKSRFEEFCKTNSPMII